MKVRVLGLICLIALTILASALAQGDPLSGNWTGDWGPSPSDRNPVTLQLKWDGKALAGTVNPGPNAVTLQKSTFDEKTGAVHMEADVRRGGSTIHYVIDGKLNSGTMIGSWNHDGRKGDFKITKGK
ncbi:MAG TPA: hypothetical protein VE422_27460 [Terriglobia bacterium]|nr:hypothetical protein [Terriglobia bacterium]